MGQPKNPLEVLSLDQLRARKSAKWRAFGDEALPLWVAEMDTPLAEPVAAALHEAIELGDTGYPSSGPYIRAFCDFAKQHWGWTVSPSQVRPVRDVMSGAVEALKLVGEIADTVIVSSPVYPPFFKYPVSAGRRVVEAPLGPDGRLDFEMLEESFNLRTTGGQAAYLLANPHNPTGVAHTREELEKLAGLAADYGIRVVADEIHAPLVYSEARFTPYLSVDPRGYAIHAASKAWNLAGLKAGLMVAGEEAVDELENLPPEVPHGPTHLGVVAQTAAFTSGQPWLESLLTGLDANRKLLGELLAKHAPEVKYTAPEATYLAWLDFSAYGFTDDEPTPGVETPVLGPAKHLLKKAGVALTPGHPFGSGGEAHARLNFATSQSILTEAVERIGQSLR
ncbi:aminotransferase class I/II-fold pyridoxal phosphate-dependent enzyme [Nesterenkonia sp. MY13]|uniref:cysteine-S-conjugate beta-lyase n=1 Tax=Nesterenkonia sedimenti TaxID=1463632 RepID=A0A7X8TIK8_9MICC|nr:aminotransferase class I/II-fold pyridoxal phosphate-dependent enzyme [Nesterenkonia sedimenti]NLS09432.1 aminotransferase class I/II-fold pyridoxal phosphate-dependent enzyme [Nesterenkonia sedimenti]